MKNTWLHSIILIVLATVLLAVTLTMSIPVVLRSAGVFSNQDLAASLIWPPLTAFATLAPGLLLGWFTRRHPLLVGAAAGIAGSMLAYQYTDSSLNNYSLFGEVIASAMYVAVAALAGRALRYRFAPTVSHK